MLSYPLHLSSCTFVHRSWNIDCSHCTFLRSLHSLFHTWCINDEFQLLHYFLLLKKEHFHLTIGEQSFSPIHHYVKLIGFIWNFLYEPVQLSWAHVQNFFVSVLPEYQKTINVVISEVTLVLKKNAIKICIYLEICKSMHPCQNMQI